MSFLSTRIGKLLLSAFLVIALNTSVKAQTTLLTGDLAFSGYICNSSPTLVDQFSFVLLKNIAATTVIRFTDYGWHNDVNAFSNAPSGILESEIVFTATSALSAGQEITIVGTTATISGGPGSGTVVFTVGAQFLAVTNISLASNGDQIFAYQGSFAAPVFIAGIHMNVNVFLNPGDPPTTTAAAWDGLVPVAFRTNNTSALPPGLTTYTNANWFGVAGVGSSEMDNVRFSCGIAPINTVPLALASLNSGNVLANWTANNTNPCGFILPTGCNYLNILSSSPAFTLHPAATTVCEAGNTSFTITATGATSYQWQVDNGGGFANITNNATYSGATTVTLNITGATNSMNGYIYRCVATNGFGSTNSNPATLTVTALPINPTLLVKTPPTGTVADGTPVSATFNAGSGGSGGCVDDYRYTTDGGVSYLPYTPGSNISTTGLAAGTGFVFIEGRRAGCATCSGSYVVLASWVVTPLPAGATTLNAGDIGFTGYTSTSVTDEFSFVLLKNIGPGTVINFTDNGWLSTNVFGVGESTATWTSNAAYPAGTEIKISGLTATLAAGGSAGTVTGAALSLLSTGDQVLAYRGLPATPTFISAIHMNVEAGSTNAAWDGAVVSGNASALPTGLTSGVNCIWIGLPGNLASEHNNAKYGLCGLPATLGPIVTLRAALNNQANWTVDDTTPPAFVLPTGCTYLGIVAAPVVTVHPSPATVCELANTSFTITATGATNYQWQVDNGGGFANVTNNANYSGATTNTLNLIATPLSFNGYIYRCIASNGGGSATSNPATLTVTALPVSPTLLAKTPASNTVADGTPVSATFNAGSGGTGGCTDDFRYTTDGGTVYTAYTPGTPISTTGVAAGSGFVFIEGRRAGCATCSGAYTVLAAWRVTPLPAAPTTLNAGDIAFSGYTSTSIPDEFSFVLLRNIGPGTVINFTDNGWLSTNVFGVGESTATWTAPAGGLPGGTEIKISALTATRSGGGAAGTVTGSALSLLSTGDQVIAYRGTAAAPTFISAIHMNVEAGSTNAAWDGAVVSGNASALPTGLTTGVNCIWIGLPGDFSSEHNNAKYGLCSLPAINGSLVALRTALNNQANWTVDDNTPPLFTLPTGCNYLSVLCPTITVTNPVNLTGTVNVAFSETFTSTGGAPTVTYSTSSTLPTGLTLSSAGVLSGIPTQGGTFPIVVIATDGGGCTGTGATYNLVINCPAPVLGTATPSSQTICSGATITTIVLAGVPGAVYNWTRDNNVAVTGIAASGAGDISGALTNTTNAPVTVTFTITPVTFGTCNQTPYTATVLVNPIADAVATPSSQTICSGATITTIALTGSVSGTTFNWTRDNTVSVTGIAASGAGDISGALTNTTNAPVTVTFTITPANSCPGASITATVLVNPTPDATATPSSQNRCSGLSITPIVMSGAVSGTSFNWTRDNFPTIGGSIGASGSGNISGTLVNNTASPVTVTFTITPTANSCPGTPITATVTVNPLPIASITGGNAYVCEESNPVLTAGFDPNYTYQWGRSLFTTPFTNLGTAQTQAITASGNYLLTVTNQYGCVDTAMTVMNIADYRFNGTLAAGDATQTGRINRFAVISTCAAPKACPGIFTATGSRLYDSYTITNTSSSPVCATIGINSFCATNIFCVAYSNSFNPASPCANYLADPGSSFTQSGFYEATIPGNGTIVVVVHEVNPSTGCAGYTLTVDVPREAAAITVTPPSPVCSGVPVTLTASAANSYSWTPGGATTQAIVVNPPSGANNYSVQLGYGNVGCNNNVATIVNVGTTPDVNAVANQYFCTGTSTPVISLTSSVPGTTFNWTNTNTAIGLGASGSGNIPSFTATNATAAPISGTITVTPVNGSCTGTPITFTITVASTPSITGVTNDDICEPGGVVNLAAAGNGAINWWNALTGGIVVNTGTTFNPNVTATTTYYVDATTTSGSQTLLAMPGQSNTFPGNVRGYWFTAPTDFVITSLSVPTTASSGPQSIAVVKFNGNTPPPVFSATTNAFTTEFFTRGNAVAGSIPCNIQVLAGEVIGILGYRGTTNSYAPGDFNTTIAGFPVQLQRLGMQFPLTTTNPQNIWREFGAATSISRIEFEYSLSQNCISAPRVAVTASVNPLPVVSIIPPGPTTICAGSNLTLTASATCNNYAFSGLLTGAQEVPANASTARGLFSGTYNGTTNQLTLNVVFNGLTGGNASAAHLHNAAPGVNGPVIIGFPGFPAATSGTYTNTFTMPPAQVVNFLAGNTYINIHNATFPGGEIRGQVVNLVTNGYTISGPMSGAQEVPANASTATGNFAGTYNDVTNQVNINVIFNNLTGGNASAGHIHAAAPGVNGPVIIPFAGFPAATSGSYSLTAALPAANLAAFMAGNTYVNIHNTTFPGGEIRGQIAPPAAICASNTYLWSPGGATTQSITVSAANTYTVTVSDGNTCSGSASTVVNVNPVPVGSATAQTICSAGTTSVALSSNTPVAGNTYTWTVAIITPPTGGTINGINNCVAACGSTIAQTLTNTGTTFGVIRYTVTPFYTNAGQTCAGTPFTVDVTVNPIPNAVATPSAQTICSGSAITTIALTGNVAGTVYNWTRDNTGLVTGIAASGSGNISGSLTNLTNAPETVTFTITPSYTNAGVTCTGPSITATVVVNPIPNAVAVSSVQTICSGSAIATINITGNVGGTVFNWTRDNTVSVTGIAASGAGNISGSLANTTNAPVTVTFTITPSFTNAGVTCTGPSITATVVVNPIPNAVATPSSQTMCSGSAITTINLTGNVTGTVFGWTRDNNGTAIGIASSGSGLAFISGNLTNLTNAPVTVTFTITPEFTNAGVTCYGPPITATVVVNPIPNAVATPASQTICSGSAITTIVNSGNVTGTVFNWTRDNTVSVTGIAANGAGDISGSLTNTTNAPLTVTFTITPSYTNAGVTCTGAPVTSTVLVNPTPNAVATPSAQTICSGSLITNIILTGNVSGTSFSWTRDNTVTVTGIAANGTGDIGGSLTNTTNAPVTVTFTITPTANGCPGPSITATVVVNPIPNTVATPASQTICSGNTITTIVNSGNVAGTVFNWTRNNTGTVTGIAANGSGNISGTLTNTTNTPVTVTFTITPSFTNAGVTCTGAPITATVLVNPTPNAVATPASQTICSGSTITTIVLSGAVSGTTFNWTRDNTGTVTGIAGTGNGNISGSLTNTTNAPVTVTFTITPTANGCPGPSITATVVVNPIPNAVATPASQTICSGNAITTIVNSGNVAGTVYDWTRNNNGTVTGIAASGSGNISGSLTNTTTAPVTVTFTITPSYTNAGVTCTGTPITATVLVNPTPDAVVTPVNQTICSAATITPIVSTGAVSGTTFNWTRDNTVSVTGIAGSGSGNISGALTNTTNAPVAVTFTITPIANGCTGASVTAVVLVNPTPNAVATPSSQTICSGAAITTIALTGNVTGTVYNWSRDNVFTVTGIANGGTGNISGALTNTTNAPITVTFTIIPSYTNGGITCTGTPINATVLVNPTPNAVATPASQTICSESNIIPIVLSGAVSGTTFNWTRNNTGTVTGIAASGSGNISGQLINTTNAPITVTFTITPTANGCPGAPITATVLVNPNPNAVATPQTQTICSGNAITPIILSGNVAGTTYSWIRDNTTTVAGIPGFGSGNISGSLTNNTNAQINVTFIITPTANGCQGPSINAIVVVNPALTITCPANIVVNAAAGTCGAVVNYPAATATGTPAPTITYSIPTGSTFPVGVTTVTATATNTCGTVSCTFTITVLDVRVPVITTQPVDRALCVGGSTSFSVVATNAASYQWQTGNANNQWANIPGATSSTFTVNNAPLSLNGANYRVVVTGPCGTAVNSNVVILTVNPLPRITLTSSTTPELVPGRTVIINTTATPAGGTYAWLFNGAPITATGPTLGPLNVDNIGRYNVIYTDLNGCVNTSSDFLVTGEYSITFWVYPNPTTSGRFQVRFNNHNGEVAKVKVYDPLGQLVYQQRVTTGPTTYARIDVDLSNAANGVYTVELLNGSDLRVGAKQLLIAR